MGAAGDGPLGSRGQSKQASLPGIAAVLEKVYGAVRALVDGAQLTENKGVATPVNWKQGEHVIIPPSVSDDDARTKYPGGWETVKPYLRRIPQPQD